MSKEIKGRLYMIFAAAFYGLCAVLSKQVLKGQLSVGMMMFLRGICGMLLLFMLKMFKREKIYLSRQACPKVALLAVFGISMTQLALNSAYAYLPVGTVTAIHFIYPVLVSVFSAIIFRERISSASKIILVISALSLFLFFEDASGGQWKGYLFSVISAFAWSFYLIYVDRSGVLKEDKLSVAFFTCAVMAAVGMLCGIAAGSFRLEGSGFTLLTVLLIALLNNVIAMILQQKGVERIGAAAASVFGVFEPVSSIVFGALLLREHLKPGQIAGSGIIILSIAVMTAVPVLQKGKRKPRKRFFSIENFEARWYNKHQQKFRK